MRSTHLRSVSTKQRAKNQQWKIDRQAALVAANYWPRCREFGLHPGEVCADGLEVHHRLPRSAGGTGDLENLMVICAKAHRQIHGNPDTSYERGWLMKRGAA